MTSWSICFPPRHHWQSTLHALYIFLRKKNDFEKHQFSKLKCPLIKLHDMTVLANFEPWRWKLHNPTKTNNDLLLIFPWWYYCKCRKLKERSFTLSRDAWTKGVYFIIVIWTEFLESAQIDFSGLLGLDRRASDLESIQIQKSFQQA